MLEAAPPLHTLVSLACLEACPFVNQNTESGLHSNVQRKCKRLELNSFSVNAE